MQRRKHLQSVAIQSFRNILSVHNVAAFSAAFLSLGIAALSINAGTVTISFPTKGTVRDCSYTVFTVSQYEDKYYLWFTANNTLLKTSTDSGSIVNAINAHLTNGGEVYFRKGSYTSFKQWIITNNNTTFTAESGTTVDFRITTPMNANNSGILITADNVTVQGFTVENCGMAGIKAKDTDNVVVRNNQFINTWTGIVFESVNNSLIDSNNVTLTQGDGIYITGDPKTNMSSNNISVIDNNVSNFGDTGIDISVGASSITYSFIQIRNNEVEGHNNLSRSPTPSGASLTVSTQVSNFTIDGNIINNVIFGMYANGFNGTVNRNLIINFSGDSGIWASSGNFTNSNVVLEYNCIYSASAIWGICTNKAWIIRNNQLTVNGRNGELAICAPNAIKQNNSAYH